MTKHIDIQHACLIKNPIPDETIIAWAQIALDATCETAEVTLRFVEIDEITQLNHTYRKQNKATNVLAFPSNTPAHIAEEIPFIGDVIICPAVLQEESVLQHKSLDAHWAHIVIHGILHLLNYDHISETDEAIMQALEIKLLKKLNFDNPYQDRLEDSERE